ncbi:hypothetical protein U1700_14830, partial [Sphingomonas sp. RB1R13]
MAEHVVDVLEAVEVEQEDGHWPLRAEDAAGTFVKERPIWQPGQRIVMGKVGKFALLAPHFDAIDDDLTKAFEQVPIALAEEARRLVDHAERADHLSRRDPKRYAGIEPQAGAIDNERIVHEGRIQGRVRDHERTLMIERMGAESHVRRG